MKILTSPIAPLPTRLRQYRELRDMSTRSLSDASGVCLRSIETIESGASLPSTRTLAQLAQALGVQVRDLFDRRPPAPPAKRRRA